MIEIQDLRKTFAHDEIIKCLNLSIEAGESIGFFGAPRSGLSCLLRLISGYLKPSTGQVLIGGRNAFTDRDYIARVISYVPEKLYLPLEMRVEEVLRFAAEIRGIDNAESAAALICEKFDLRDCWKTQLAELPESFQRMIQLAQAFVHQPQCMIFDNPFEVRNSWLILRFSEWVLQQSSHSILIMSSHSVEDLLPFCQRIMILEDGQLTGSFRSSDCESSEQIEMLLRPKSGKGAP